MWDIEQPQVTQSNHIVVGKAHLAEAGANNSKFPVIQTELELEFFKFKVSAARTVIRLIPFSSHTICPSSSSHSSFWCHRLPSLSVGIFSRTPVSFRVVCLILSHYTSQSDYSPCSPHCNPLLLPLLLHPVFLYELFFMCCFEAL